MPGRVLRTLLAFSGARRRLDLAARTTPFNTHTARPGRSNSEHLAARVERVCDPLHRAMVEPSCVLSDAGSAGAVRAS